ncbi:hypothetical protein JTB14_037460 [Gonioctena quinquepunctata]|nr:hypothetical protein JTB14_037460 [Gonioctena quinquepunctata]
MDEETRKDEDSRQVAQWLLHLIPLDPAIIEIDRVFHTNNVSDSSRITILKSLNRPEVYEAYMKKFKPGCSDENKQERSFITPHRKHVAKKVPPPPETTKSDSMELMETFVPNIKVSNKFGILADQDTEKDETSNTGVLKPPPIVIREKKQWPKINETLKNFGITSENFNTRDGIRMILPSMDMYTKSTNILDHEKIQYHTFRSPQEREIRAIFKGIAEDIETTTIMKDFQDKGFAPRIVARFKNRKGQNMPIVLVIVPGSQATIKDINQICDMEVHFEHQRRKNRIGQCYNCQKFGHSAYNCKAEPVCRHCAGNHESRAHDKDDVGPNKCSNCEGPHKSNFQGCPAFPSMERKDRNKEPPPQGVQGHPETQETTIPLEHPRAQTSTNFLWPWMN